MDYVKIARTAVGFIGNVIAVILFLSPVSIFQQIKRRGSVEQFPPWPYLASFFNCGIWVLYGLPMVHPDSLLVCIINGIGLVIETVYLILFLIYSDCKKRILVLLTMSLELIILGVLSHHVFTSLHTHEDRSTIVGKFAISSNIVMYAAPLSVMKDVISTKSVEFMSFSLSLLSFLNGISWTIYGLIPVDDKGQDWYIVVPNGIGAFLGLVQVVLYGVFSNRQMPDEEEVTQPCLPRGEETERVAQPCLSRMDETERVTES